VKNALVFTFLAAAVALFPACNQAEVTGKNGPASGRAPQGPNGAGAGMQPGIGLPDASAADAAAATPGEKCAEETYAADAVPLDLLLLVDTSGSMSEPAGQRSKWEMARDALVTFVRDPKSANLGVGLQFFPLLPPVKACASDADCGEMAARPNFWCHQNAACLAPGMPVAGARECDPGLPLCRPGTACTPLGRCAVTGVPCVPGSLPCPAGIPGDDCQEQPKTCQNLADSPGSCMPADYGKLVVPIATLPAAATTLGAVIAAKAPIGGTPMGPAAEGALMHLRQHLASNPGRKAVLVLVTDGLPMNCAGDSIEAVVARLSAARMATPAIATYVIGVFDPLALPVGGGNSQGALASLATAGGTNMPFVLSPTADLTQRFIESLNQIRGAALSCEFKIPLPAAPGGGMANPLDFGKVNVRINTPTASDDLPYVTSADRCDATRGGWYYDVPPAQGKPTRVLVCPATCTRLAGGGNVKVEIRYGCATRVD
jgi:hypothetical protein